MSHAQSPSSPPATKRTLHTIEGRRFFDPIIDQLVRVRHARGLTQDEVNAMIGCADRLVGKWECRDKYPSSYFLVLWAQALGVTLTVRMEDEINDVEGDA